LKRSASAIETYDRLRDLDSDNNMANDSEPDVSGDACDGDFVGTGSPAESPRKERRTLTQTSPCRKAAQMPHTPVSMRRHRPSMNLGEDDVFTTPLFNMPRNNLYAKLVAAHSVNRSTDSETLGQSSRQSSFDFGSQIPDSPFSHTLEPSSVLEYGQLLSEFDTKITGLLGKEFRKAEGYKQGRDTLREILQQKKDELARLQDEIAKLQSENARLQDENAKIRDQSTKQEVEIEQLQKERKQATQVGETLKSQLGALRLQSQIDHWGVL